MIDPGGDLHEVMNFLEGNGLSLDLIVSTHGHFDHIFAVNELIDRFHSTFIIGAGEDAVIDWSVAISPQFFGQRIERPNIHKLISENNPLKVSGIELTPMHTPGHTPGSYSFILGETIFTGDVLFKGSVGRTDFGGNINDLKSSLMKIMQLNDKFTVLPGHGQNTTIGHERDTNPYVSQLLCNHL